MRISDGMSDVCSADLRGSPRTGPQARCHCLGHRWLRAAVPPKWNEHRSYILQQFQKPDWVDAAEYPFRSRLFATPHGNMHYIDEGEGEVLLFVDRKSTRLNSSH